MHGMNIKINMDIIKERTLCSFPWPETLVYCHIVSQFECSEARAVSLCCLWSIGSRYMQCKYGLMRTRLVYIVLFKNKP